MAGRYNWGARIVSSALVALLCVTAVACKPKVKKSVLLLGDSITLLSTPQILNHFQARDFGYLATFNAIVSIGACPRQQVPADYWPKRIASIRTKMEPEVVVIQLGTNDVQTGDHACVDDYVNQAVAPMLDALPDVPVFELTVREDIGEPGLAAQLNAELESATSRWPNLTILDYDAHFRPRCAEWCDGAHLSAAGEDEYGRWLTQELDQRFPNPTTSTTTTSTTTTSTTTTSTTTTSTTTTSTTTTTTTPPT